MISIEQKVSLAFIHPAMFGTNDSGGYVEAEKHLHAIDLKYGYCLRIRTLCNHVLILHRRYRLRHARRDWGGERGLVVAFRVANLEVPLTDSPCGINDDLRPVNM